MSNKVNIKKKKEKIAPKLRFPEFHDNWETQCLDDFADIITERTGSKKCILMSIVQGVGLVSQMEKFGREIAGEQYKNYFMISKNDFAYNKSATKEYPQGFIAMYSGNESAAVPNSIFTCFKVQTAKIFPQFLDYQFKGNFHGRWLQKYITVGARAHGSLNIDNSDLLSLPIPVPQGKLSFTEQQKIANCLTSIDILIDAESSKLDALKKHKKGLLQVLFPQEGETAPRVRFPEFRDTPEWKIMRLGQIAETLQGYGFPETYQGKASGEYPFYKVSDISISLQDSERFITKAANYIEKDTIKILKAKLIPEGATIFAKIGEAIKSNRRVITTSPCLIDNNVAGVKRIEGESLDLFIYYLLAGVSLKDYAGGVVPAVSKAAIDNIPIACPGLQEQQKIADCLSSLDELIAAQAQKLAIFKVHKKGLMQGLFPSLEEVG